MLADREGLQDWSTCNCCGWEAEAARSKAGWSQAATFRELLVILNNWFEETKLNYS